MTMFPQEKYINADFSVSNIQVAYKDTSRRRVWSHDGGFRTCYAFSFAEKGNHSIYINGVKHEIRTGDIVFTRKNIYYKSNGKEYLTQYGIAFNTHSEDTIDILNTVTSPAKPEKYKALFEEATILYNTKPPLYMLELKKIVYELFCMLVKEQSNQSPEKKHATIEKSITYINTGLYNSSLLLSEAAKESGISFNYFRQLFKEQYGITPIEYVINERLVKAKKLLIHSPMTIDEIAEACGFSNSVYFYRIFKKHTGTTPNKYRKTN